MYAARLSTILILATLFATGCATTPRETLPTGATLLGSDDGSCDGPIEIEGRPDVKVGQGKTVTLAVQGDEDKDWRCLSDSDHHGEITCPDGTDYVRIIREEGKEGFRLECYGG